MYYNKSAIGLIFAHKKIMAKFTSDCKHNTYTLRKWFPDKNRFVVSISIRNKLQK